MKKKHSAWISLLVTCTAIAALSGCSLFPSPARPVFPYDVAVENGYAGSEGSWLAAQQAETHEHALYEEAKADGSFEGDFLAFLGELAKIGYAPADPAYGVQRALRSAVSVVSSAGQGSGVILSVEQKDGEQYPDLYILTNEHVVCDAEGPKEPILCYLYGGERSSRALRATCTGYSVRYDIAVLHVEGDTSISVSGTAPHTNGEILLGSDVCAVTAADSDAVCAGESVYAIGNADGKGIAVTEGTVSVATEYILISGTDGKTSSMLEIRTDAAVNHGNSGGGFFNARGELIGIVNARSEKDGVESFGYAIPANRALAVAENILARAAEGKRGVAVADLGCTFATADSRFAYDGETGKCYLSESVAAERVTVFSPAHSAGLRAGDVILSVALRSSSGGEKKVAVTRLHMIEDMLLRARAGDTVVLEARHASGGTVTVSVPVGATDFTVVL